jgi:hypothetical protein
VFIDLAFQVGPGSGPFKIDYTVGDCGKPAILQKVELTGIEPASGPLACSSPGI